MMLAGSVGPQLAQNLYKLMTTPHSDGLESGLPQQVNTWEEYYPQSGRNLRRLAYANDNCQEQQWKNYRTSTP